MTSLQKSLIPISKQKQKKKKKKKKNKQQKFTGTGTHLIEILMSKT